MEAHSIPARRAPRVLVVDDEKLVRLVTMTALRHGGFDTAEASTAAEALALDGADARFDLAVVDMTLPDMNGTALASAFRERFPDMPVLFVSGNSGARALAQREGGAFLAKPYTASRLLGMVRVLTGAPSAEDSEPVAEIG